MAGQPLELVFDRGTVLCRGEPPGRDLGRLPGMRWDPRVDAYRAPARFHPRIAERLRAAGVPIRDGVAAWFPPPPAAAPPELRWYQGAALDAWTLAGERGVVVLPTGSGKTRVAVAAIAGRPRGALCMVPTRVLVEQWREALADALGVEVGCYGGGLREARPVTVATFESAYRHMALLGNRFELLVVDEAHHFGGGARDEALEMSAAPRRLGLTATPPREAAGVRLAQLVGPTVFELSVADLAGRFLAELELVDLRLELTPRERADYEREWGTFRTVFDHFQRLAPGAAWGDFARWAARTPQGRQGLSAWRRARRLLALTEAKLEAVGRLLGRHRDARTLVFTADVEAAYRIAREHLVMPITADIGARERREMLAAFGEGSIRAIVSARVLNEGLDVPAADVGIVVGGALGEREHVQRVGRLLRPAPGKTAILYELVSRDTAEVGQSRRKRRGLG